LVVGSGGISHEPPVPQLANASTEVTQWLIADGRNPTSGARTIAAAKTFAQMLIIYDRSIPNGIARFLSCCHVSFWPSMG